MSLALCSSCKRFARIGVCPFCGTGIGVAAPRNKARMARAALMVVATTAGPFDCGTTTAPAYGAPPPTAVVAAPDAGTISVAAYGAPAPPPSVDIGPITMDSGTSTDASVAPKPKDAGVKQHRQVPAYGLPPDRRLTPSLDDRK